MKRCRLHPDLEKALAAERAKVEKLAQALDRYGAHEPGCPMRARGWRFGKCACGLHARILEGGVKP